MVPKPERPTGVTILAILGIIGGVFGLCGGIGIIGLASSNLLANSSVHFNAGTLTILGIIALVIAVGDLVFGIGALQLMPWAWTLGVAIEGFGILYSIASIALLGSSVFTTGLSIIVSGIVIYYLFQPQVQRAFGRAVAA